jgi:predicted amidophosphoribosyltransferase
VTFLTIPLHPYSRDCEYLAQGCCYRCCERCNQNRHVCAGCGEDLDHNGRESDGREHEGCTDD